MIMDSVTIFLQGGDGYARKNINGSRKIWKSVSEAKMFAGSRLWPEREYTTNDNTDAKVGNARAIALFPERIISKERI